MFLRLNIQLIIGGNAFIVIQFLEQFLSLDKLLMVKWLNTHSIKQLKLLEFQEKHLKIIITVLKKQRK